MAGRTAAHVIAPDVAAAALAGYAAINASAFLTACELGIQPLFFKDAGGAPLYAPYPLHIAIPAMMIGHLTFAGIGGTGCFGRSGRLSAALESCAAGSEALQSRTEECDNPSIVLPVSWRTTRPLWIRLALLMLLTPLGILAAGTAWGEWSARDFSDPEMRQKIAAASGNVAPPAEQPRGFGAAFFFMERALSPVRASIRAPACFRIRDVGHVWQRPYSWILLLMGWMSASAMTRQSKGFAMSAEEIAGSRRAQPGFFCRRAGARFDSEQLAKKNGLLQSLDPRVKIVAILPLIVDRGAGATVMGDRRALRCCCRAGFAVESAPGHAGKKSLAERAHFHRDYLSSRSVPDSRPRNLHACHFSAGR